MTDKPDPIVTNFKVYPGEWQYDMGPGHITNRHYWRVHEPITAEALLPPAEPPAPPEPTPPPQTWKWYTVVAGDGWYRIAKKNNMDVRDLLELNGLEEFARLHPGDRLKVAIQD